MTDSVPPNDVSPRAESGFFRLAFEFLRGDSLVARFTVLALLTLALKIPLDLVGGVVADRRDYEGQAVKNVTETWGGAQTFVGPMMVVPYRRADDRNSLRTLTLLPEKLIINGEILPEQRRRGLFAVTVYTAALDVIAEFPTNVVREQLADGRSIDWSASHLAIGLTEPKSIDATTVEIDGQQVEWVPGSGTMLASLHAPLAATGLANRSTVVVRFRIRFGGSASAAFAPIGRRTEVNVTSPWPSPSFTGRYLPVSQSVNVDGFRAKWATSHLGRGYGQLWDSATTTEPSASTVVDSAFGFTLFNPIDAYRETDRSIKYGIMFIALTFAAGLLFELAAGLRLHAAQYGLIGLSLCVFYLLLLSFSEQIGFGPAYVVSASAVALQASAYNWSLQRHAGPALAFGAVLTGLYAGLYTLLQLEDVALLAGSLVLFAVLSLAMWFTRNLHRA
jgi:inner membrane protein